jgi:protein-L-isoaspartate(D-aspartate) O-methyltransferase
MLAAARWIKDPRVLEVLASVPRHLFFEAATPEDAYADKPMPIGLGQTISQPAVVGAMTEALTLHGNERVLEIGTGCGYQTAVLSRLCAHVESVERIRSFADSARARLTALGYANVSVHSGDGYNGLASGAPYDRIVVTAAPPELPRALVLQLAEGGIMVLPLGTGEHQRLLRLTRHGNDTFQEDLGPILFVPMLHGED